LQTIGSGLSDQIIDEASAPLTIITYFAGASAATVAKARLLAEYPQAHDLADRDRGWQADSRRAAHLRLAGLSRSLFSRARQCPGASVVHPTG